MVKSYECPVCAHENVHQSSTTPRDPHCLSGVWPLHDVRVVQEELAASPGQHTGGDRAVLTHDARAAGGVAGGVSDSGCGYVAALSPGGAKPDSASRAEEEPERGSG